MLTLNDGRKEMYQWDIGRIATIDVECDVVHFSNLKYGASLAVEVKNGEVSIPNKLLTSGEQIYCWAFVADENGNYTKQEQTLNVNKRAKPSDYVYTETETLTWKSLDERITELEKGGTCGSCTTSTMTGATADTDGAAGLVPQPKAGEQNMFLKGDGTWAEVDTSKLSLGFGADGKLYIMVSGIAIGDGVVIDGASVPDDGVAVFVADFSGASPSAEQFYSWEGRTLWGRTYDSLKNISCSGGTATLKSVYDTVKAMWVEQMMTTAGLFESDEFTCTFRAKFSGMPGSWQYVITYGTGTYWTDGMYSDGLLWAEGGEIDAFEQVGGYAETPNYMITPTVRYGKKSDYVSVPGENTTFTTDVWHDFKFTLKNGVVETFVDGVSCGSLNLNSCKLSSDVVYDYNPFLHPQAFYIGGQNSTDDAVDKTNAFQFEISDFKVIQNENVACTGLEIYPQMWQKGTELIFPVGSELFFEKVFTPANTSNKACIWTSSDPTVASVVQGHVKVITAGSCTITATCGDISATYTLTANETANIPCVHMECAAQISGQVGTSVDLGSFVTLLPSFSTDVIQYTVSNSEIASVSDGKLTFISGGECMLTVVCGEFSSVVKVISESSLVLAADLATDATSETGLFSLTSGEQYTISYRIANATLENPGTSAVIVATYTDGSTARKAPVLIINSSGVCISLTGDTSNPNVASDGDWITVVFTATEKTTMTYYKNGVEIKTGTMYKAYMSIDQSIRIMQTVRSDAYPMLCDRVEVYHGDMHDLYV